MLSKLRHVLACRCLKFELVVRCVKEGVCGDLYIKTLFHQIFEQISPKIFDNTPEKSRLMIDFYLTQFNFQFKLRKMLLSQTDFILSIYE